MKKLSIIICTLAIASLSGCKSLYGNYHRPEAKSSGLVREPLSDDTLALSDTASIGTLPWKSVFTDKSLQALIQQGLDNNLNLQNAALNVDMAEAQLLSARLAFLPSFAFTPQGTIASWDGNKATQTYNLPVNASWNIDLFGKLRSQKQAAKMALLQTKSYKLSVQTSLIANIANAYYTLLMLDKQVEIVDSMSKLTKETYEIMKVQQDLGRVRSTAVQSAENNYYATLNQKLSLQRQIREAENAMCLLLGQPGASIPRSTLEAQELPQNLAVGVPLKMLSARPDVYAYEMALAQCFYNVQTARARFYPSLSIAATGAFTNSAGLGIVNPGKWLLSAVGSLVQPIFQNGQLVAGLRVAKDKYEQAYNDWQNALLKAGNEVSNALVLYNTSAERSKIEAEQIRILKKNVDDTRELMGATNTTYLEVIQAQSGLLNVQISKVQDDFYKMQAVVNLYYALGGGVQ